MYTLDAEFANTNGKSQHLRLKGFDPRKTAGEIRASLEKLTKQVLQTEQTLADICIPEDLVITEERPQADVLVRAIEFPRDIDPRELTDSQTLVIISACVTAGATLEDIRIDDSTSPSRLVLIQRITEEKANEKLFQKPPEYLKKRRKRLLDHIRKRE